MSTRRLVVGGLLGLAIAAGGCSTDDATTTDETVSEKEAEATEPNAPEEPTLADLKEAILGPDHPSYYNVNAFDCIEPRRFTPVSEALACMSELRRWYAERRRIQGPSAKFCVPFYRYVCIPGAGGRDFECPEVLRYYSGGQTVTVSKFSDPLTLDEDRDGVGCEPYP